MSSTTLIPLDPAISRQRSTRVLTISANLLPEEIVAARRARSTRTWVIVVVAVVAVLCAGWFVQARYQTQQADKELTAATSAVTDLQRDQREFAETVSVRNETAILTQQLTTVMATDLDWATLLDTLRAAGVPSNIKIVNVNGKLDEAGPAAAAESLPSATTATSIGTVLVTATGPDKKSVALYAEALARQFAVVGPYITNVDATSGEPVAFSLEVGVASASLCGRFTTACKNTGGN